MRFRACGREQGALRSPPALLRTSPYKQVGFPAMIISLAHLETIRKPPLVYNSTNFSIPHIQRDYHPKPCVPSARWGRPCEASATELIRYGGSGGRHPLMHAWRPPGGFCYFSPRRKVAPITNQERRKKSTCFLNAPCRQPLSKSNRVQVYR